MTHEPLSKPHGTLRPVHFDRLEALRPSAVPRPLTSFIGREDDIAMVMALLARDDVRLLTLTGPGGVGKTRLAIQVATEIAGQYPDGVIWVPLVQTPDAALVGPAISRAVQASRPAPLDADPVSLLRNVHGLLVLDNFEHVIDAASLIATFLAECLALTVLVTSRQGLELTGEHVYTVPSFSVAEFDDPAMSNDSLAPEAVQLFVERARARDASFTLTEENAEAIKAICSTLDGLPLAIELAAAQVPLFTPASLLPRLEERLSILTRGPIDTHDRHRTMRGAIGWSYDLLDAPLQTAFRRLAVFVGGFTLEAAEAVIGHPGEILEILSSLLSRCLIAARPVEDGTTRYWMLETIREFGLERLGESGDEAATSRLWAGANYRSDIESGLELGQAVADLAVQRGESDGSDAEWDGTGWPTGAGLYETTPPNFADPFQPLGGTWATWVLPSGDALRPAAFPEYGTSAWNSELSAVQRATAGRTPEQERTIDYWLSKGPDGFYTSYAQDMIERHALNEAEAASVLTMVGVAMYDGVISTWDAKFHFWIARPITNDSSLDLYIPTPPYPAYPAGFPNACGAYAAVLADVFPSAAADLFAMAWEGATQRHWSGIHYVLDNDIGLLMGGQVGRMTVDMVRGVTLD